MGKREEPWESWLFCQIRAAFPVFFCQLNKITGGSYLVRAFFIHSGQFPGWAGRQKEIGDISVWLCVSSGNDGAADVPLCDGAQGIIAGGFKQDIGGVAGLFKQGVDEISHGGSFCHQHKPVIFKVFQADGGKRFSRSSRPGGHGMVSWYGQNQILRENVNVFIYGPVFFCDGDKAQIQIAGRAVPAPRFPAVQW